VVHGAPDLPILLQRLPAFIIHDTCLLVSELDSRQLVSEASHAVKVQSCWLLACLAIRHQLQ
jgi:hypothetical protein